MRKFVQLFFIVYLIALSNGCSDKIKISGKVTFTDGEPVNFGSVCFETPAKSFYGYLDKNGHYSPGESKDGEGIPPGNYQVWISGSILSEEILNKDGESTGRSVDTVRIAEKYTYPHPESLTFEVKRGGSKTFDFTVERPEPPSKKR